MKPQMTLEKFDKIIIDGRENRGQLFKLSVGHNGCKSVWGAGNPVHTLHSDFVVVCQPLRAWYKRA